MWRVGEALRVALVYFGPTLPARASANPVPVLTNPHVEGRRIRIPALAQSNGKTRPCKKNEARRNPLCAPPNAILFDDQPCFAFELRLPSTAELAAQP